ncbi:hypothetical protein HK097_008921 [Rhizophlyctis rosea]|uniref:Uncharacterized protein n=1 Tax=Rhizophlyctis rosea TaxID=64517 RepID=A0AAD5SCN5_9FUNG|nr:hypothetical protein HK097_008921 [Rhizophlyctis rosea]
MAGSSGESAKRRKADGTNAASCESHLLLAQAYRDASVLTVDNEDSVMENASVQEDDSSIEEDTNVDSREIPKFVQKIQTHMGHLADTMEDCLELELCLQDLLDEEGNALDPSDLQRESGDKALKAVQAVFPQIQREDYSMETFMKQELVERVLGTTKNINSKNAEEFYELLYPYVGQGDGSEIQWWPLVSKIVVSHKWDVLSPGVVLVDLPGGGDANPARAAIADGYLQKADQVFVVASIVRAAASKVAQDYLTKAFVRELRMGGRSDAVAYICTHIDDLPKRPGDLKNLIRKYHLKEEFDQAFTEHKGRIKSFNRMNATSKERAVKKAEKSAFKNMKLKCIEMRSAQVQEARQESFAAMLKEGLPEEMQDRYKEYKLPMYFVSPLAFLSLRDPDDDEEWVKNHLLPQQARKDSQIKQLGLQEQRRAANLFGELAKTRVNMICNHLLQSAKGALDPESLSAIQQFCKKTLNGLRREWKSLVESAITSSREGLEDLRTQMEDGAEDAKAKGDGTSQQNGGFHHMTYRATCQRKGRFHAYDMNHDLVEPMYDAVEAEWIVFFDEVVVGIDKKVNEMELQFAPVENVIVQDIIEEIQREWHGTKRAARKHINICMLLFYRLPVWAHQKNERKEECQKSRQALHHQVITRMVPFAEEYYAGVKKKMYEDVAVTMVSHLDAFMENTRRALRQSWKEVHANLETHFQRFAERKPLNQEALEMWQNLSLAAQEAKQQIDEVMKSEV